MKVNEEELEESEDLTRERVGFLGNETSVSIRGTSSIRRWTNGRINWTLRLDG